MTKVLFLDELQRFCKNAVKGFRLATAVQKGDTKIILRPPDVYKMRLPNSKAAEKVVPYIILQLVTGKDEQLPGQPSDSTALVRLIFCVYSKDEQEGALSLLNVMEAVRIELLKAEVIGEKFSLDKKEGVETLIYPDDTAPYFMGEMMTAWHLPPVEREICLWEDMKGEYYDEKEISRNG